MAAGRAAPPRLAGEDTSPPLTVAFRDIPPFAGSRVDENPHAMSRRGIDERLVGRTETWFERRIGRLAAAWPNGGRAVLGGLGAISSVLDEGDDQQEPADRHQPQAARCIGAAADDDGESPEELDESDDDQDAADDHAHRCYSIAWGASGSATTTTAVP